MAIIYPYPLGAFADLLRISAVVWDIQRNDELSGTGDGRIWQAELAPPLWTGQVSLTTGRHNTLKQIAALVRKLHGSQESFLLYDPLSKYPQSDPTGSILGSASVQVNAVGAEKNTISLKGLPVGYVLTLGDKIQINYSSSPVRFAFLEVSETAVADEAGVIPAFDVFPHVPVGVAEDDTVKLSKPACRVILLPGSHQPGTASGNLTRDASFKVIQKK